MEINLSNYETYFLLFADNELNTEERIAVLDFVHQYPNLKSELNAITTSCLQDEALNLNKAFLMKLPSGKSVEEALLLHFDKELEETDNTALQELLNNHAALRHEKELLKAAYLQADDSLIYVNKEALYRHESTVFLLSYWKQMVAIAVLIMALLWGTRELFGSKEIKIITIASQKTEDSKSLLKHPIIKKPSVPHLPGKNHGTGIANNPVPSLGTAAQTQASSTSTNNHKLITPQGNDNNQDDSFNPPHSSSNEKNTHTQNSNWSNINNFPRNETSFQPVLISNTIDEPIIKQKDIKDAVMQLTASRALDEDINTITLRDIYQTSFQNNEEAGDFVLAVKEERITKSKVGGFIQKVKNEIEEGKSKIKIPKRIKVGGLEINI